METTSVKGPDDLSFFVGGDRISTVSVTAFVQGPLLSTGCAEASLMGDHWYLNRLVVKPSYRGKKIGTALLERLLSELETRGGLPVIVEPGGYGSDVEELRSFYQRFGFEEKESYLVRVFDKEESE